ncbi:hypothetical protein [Salimicrobium salexigens]|uniref:5-methylcytosine-specific restriction enzyme subunit McrC n=1 Tax=Salimicrobium salexigens TaxID=908941 RepID=A0ABY1L1T1_9BACI|nr:hypothetical protein [Salimicrobium salexigens]SIS90591.1 hypothetical protein SAMN05421758_10949 [Salimicrobium salexigens]
MKRSAEELIEEISDFLVVYLKSGKVGFNSFIEKTDLEISNLDQLLQIHFLMQAEVKEFVRELPTLIRRFKTSTTLKQDTYHGKIKGQVNWPRTINERLAKNARDRTIFAVNERNREYAIKENQVLLELLQVLETILFTTIDNKHYEKYAWFQEWKNLKLIVRQMLTKNVYLSRVRREQAKVTDRMVIDTLKHRNPLYRGAASLLQQYRKIKEGEMNEEEIRHLLRETFIFPKEESVLFELYWVVRLIETNTKKARLNVMDGNNNLVAEWEDKTYLYKLYHDSDGSSELNFSVSTKEVASYYHPFLNRQLASHRSAETLAHKFFGKGFDSSMYWRGRPDIIVEMYDKQDHQLKKVVIGEVKHTTNQEYAITGLRELLDYLTLIKNKSGEYLEDVGNVTVKGILFTDRVTSGKVGEGYLDLREVDKRVVHVSV